MTGSLQNLERSLNPRTPMTSKEVLALADLVLWKEDKEWVPLLEGFPREWHETMNEAKAAAKRWGSGMTPTIEHASGPTWLVFGGDQCLFTSTSREEADSFIFGVAAGRFIGK
jgi:hypothetical protein